MEAPSAKTALVGLRWSPGRCLLNEPRSGGKDAEPLKDQVGEGMEGWEVNSPLEGVIPEPSREKLALIPSSPSEVQMSPEERRQHTRHQRGQQEGAVGRGMPGESAVSLPGAAGDQAAFPKDLRNGHTPHPVCCSWKPAAAQRTFQSLSLHYFCSLQMDSFSISCDLV